MGRRRLARAGLSRSSDVGRALALESIETTIRDRFRDMRGGDRIGAPEVGDRTRHFQNAVIGARRERQARHGIGEQRSAYLAEAAEPSGAVRVKEMPRSTRTVSRPTPVFQTTRIGAIYRRQNGGSQSLCRTRRRSSRGANPAPACDSIILVSITSRSTPRMPIALRLQRWRRRTGSRSIRAARPQRLSFNRIAPASDPSTMHRGTKSRCPSGQRNRTSLSAPASSCQRRPAASCSTIHGGQCVSSLAAAEAADPLDRLRRLRHGVYRSETAEQCGGFATAAHLGDLITPSNRNRSPPIGGRSTPEDEAITIPRPGTPCARATGSSVTSDRSADTRPPPRRAARRSRPRPRDRRSFARLSKSGDTRAPRATGAPSRARAARRLRHPGDNWLRSRAARDAHSAFPGARVAGCARR